VAGEQIHQHALMVWIKVLDQNKCHAIIGWQGGEKFLACIEPAGGSANSNNRDVWSTVCHSGYFL
jgi:hypothetical protein